METDILIVGGGPAGLVSAVTARKNNPKKKITLIRREKEGVIPCGIPYIFSRLDSVNKNLMPDQPLIDARVDLIINEAIKIDIKNKKVILKDNQEWTYEKLIIATGSQSVLIPIPGAEMTGVWQIKKDCSYLRKLRQALLAAKNIVIIGGGFIGVELAEELSSFREKNISIVEMLPHCLALNFDDEFALAAEEKIKEKGVNIYTGSRVAKISGRGKVEYVELADGKKIPADQVIISIGTRPNIELAKSAGIKIEEKGGIWVDEYMATSEPDIFAIGDCAQTKDFITGENVPIMLASVACFEARIAAANLYEAKIKNQGTVGAFSTYLDGPPASSREASRAGLALAAVGSTEERAKKEKLDILVGKAKAPNHHPGHLLGTQPITVKLIFSKKDKILIGGEIMGPESVGEMINILSLAVQKKLTAGDLVNLQFATHPLLTPAPTCYPLIIAASNIKT